MIWIMYLQETVLPEFQLCIRQSLAHLLFSYLAEITIEIKEVKNTKA